MKKVAIVGYGFMGRTHCGAWKKCPGAKIVAVCDANLAQLTAKVTGNIRSAADNSALPKTVEVYDSFDKLLAAGGFDIVDITLPTPLHAEMTVRALAAGYHVLCEKPMALTLEDCDRMLVAAKKANRKLFVAQCVRFFPAYAYVADLIRMEKYGKVIAAEFTRFMSAPKWSPKGGSWMLDESKSGGLYVDAHIHDADYIASVFGLPKAVSSKAHRSARGYIDYQTTRYDYSDGKVVTASSSFAAADALTFDSAARIFFEKATVYLGDAYVKPITIYPTGGKPMAPKLGKLSGYDLEVRAFLALVEGRKTSAFAPADARKSISLVLAERMSAEKGKKVLL